MDISLLCCPLQNTLTGLVKANTNEDLKGLTLAHLEFLGVERPPSSLVYQGGTVLHMNSSTYEAASLRLTVNFTHHLNRDLKLELMGIWHYQVNMK